MGNASGADALLWPLLRQKTPTTAFSGPQVGVVVTASTYRCTFTIPSYSPTLVFGPAPYKRSAVAPAGTDPNDDMIPPPGTSCLAVFVGPGIDQPWVICFADWP
jgi:hypothetical protein